MERERRVGRAGVTGEVIHEESSLLRGDGNRRRRDGERLREEGSVEAERN